LAFEHPDRLTHRWIAREGGGGGWEVVKVRVPAGLERESLTPTLAAKPRPSKPDDPPPLDWQNVPPF
jgi:hypothetical protein